MDDEKQFIRRLSSKSKELDKPEIAVEFARLLMAHERYLDAQLIVRTALEEGPRYDLYELRAASTHSNLDELWTAVHEALRITPDKDSTDLYNGNLDSPAPDWPAVLQKLTGR
jgi:uncharacterized protein HemY